jgi:hypothetical protein
MKRCTPVPEIDLGYRAQPETVQITVEQLRHLLEVLIAGDVLTAKEWLIAAIKKAGDEIRERQK